MNLQAIIAAMPWLKKLWDWLPRRLRFPLLGLAAFVWLYRRLRGNDATSDTDADGAAGDGDAEAPGASDG